MRVLILDGHSPAAIESAQSLGRRGAQIDIACEEPDCFAFHSRYVQQRLKQPPMAPLGNALEWLRRLHAQRRYDLVIPATDVSLHLLRGLGEQEEARMKAVLPVNAALDMALDKQATCRLAQALGIPAPETLFIARSGAVPECSHYPVVLKSCCSRVTMDGVNTRLEAVIARDARQRETVLAAWLPHTAVQQQQFVSGRGFGIEMLFDRGRPVWHFAHQRVHEVPLTGGGSSYRRSIEAPPLLLAMSERLLCELGWHGVAMVEFRGNGTDRHYLMEINPRLWGSLALAIDCGVDFPVGLAALARGEALEPQPRYRVGYYSRMLMFDVQWQKMNLRADHADPLLLTRPPWKAGVELLRPLYGCESWDFFDWTDLAVTAKVLRDLGSFEAARLSARLARWRRRRSALAHQRRVMQRLAGAGRPSRILFVCHGNICRSPVAARLAARELNGVEVRSAGLHVRGGRPSPEHVSRAAACAGMDLATHRSRRLSESEVAHSELIVCMDLENLRAIQREYPAAWQRTLLLGPFGDGASAEIADPYALSERETGDVIEQIKASVHGLRAWLERLPLRDAANAGGSEFGEANR